MYYIFLEQFLSKIWRFYLETFYILYINNQSVFCLKIKHSSCISTIWKQFEHQILGFTVSIATLNCMQNIQMQYLVISFIGGRYFESAVSFENVFFKILQRHILYMRYPFGHLHGRTY